MVLIITIVMVKTLSDVLPNEDDPLNQHSFFPHSYSVDSLFPAQVQQQLQLLVSNFPLCSCRVVVLTITRSVCQKLHNDFYRKFTSSIAPP